MLGVYRRMISTIASLKIPEISRRMAVKFVPTIEAAKVDSPMVVKFVTEENLTMLKASTLVTNPTIAMQMEGLTVTPRSLSTVMIPDQTLWNDNFGSVYRNRLMLVSLGKEAEVNLNTIRECVNTATVSLRNLKQTHALMEIPKCKTISSDIIASAMANILVCSNHLPHDGKYFTAKDKQGVLLKEVQLFPSQNVDKQENQQMEQAVKYGALLGEETVNARMWANAPSSEMNPRTLELLCRDICDKNSIEINVLQAPDLRREKLNMIDAVGQGASVPPRLIVMTYIGDNTKPKFTGLVGKGVCFDSGGLNLKPTGSIEDMHLDMGGAAAVLGALETLARLNAPVNVVAAIPAVENMIDAESFKPGSILKSYNGQFVEVCNTDAEGRLILADAMAYLQAKYELESLVDICTLTGAICVGLGEYTAGLFSNSGELAAQLMRAGREVKEPCWPMPILQEHVKEIKASMVADLRSMGAGRYGGACTAAAFLKQFVGKDLPWAHLDIAGVGMTSKAVDWIPQGGTGYGVQLLAQWALERYTQPGAQEGNAFLQSMLSENMQ